MSKKTTRRFVKSEKVQLRHKQQLPEPADEMTADVIHHESDSKDPFSLSHMALSLPVNIHYENTSGAKQEDSDNSASSDDPFRDYFRKLQDVEYFDTDSSSWDQSAASFMSWSDEIESTTTERLQKLMDDVECILYDEPVETPPSKEIIEECQMWKETFPHMRVRGRGIKMSATMPQEEECCDSIVEEEIFAVDGIVDDGKESGSVKQRGSLTEDSGAHCKKDVKTEESKSCQLEDMVEKYVLQQLASYIQSEVIKKVTSDLQTLEGSSGKKCNKLPDLCVKNSSSQRTVTSVLSDSESDTSSAQTFLSTSLRSREVPCSSSRRSEFRVQDNDAFSSPPLFDVGNYSAEYPSFSVIGSAPVSLPPPRTASSSVREARSFHSAAERNKRQYADRRFSCGFTARERSSHQIEAADEKNQNYKALLYSSNNRKQFLPPNSQDKLNKRLVLPPIDRTETQKMSASHVSSKALSVHGSGFSRTEFISPSVSQPGISKFDRRKKEQQVKKVSYH